MSVAVDFNVFQNNVVLTYDQLNKLIATQNRAMNYIQSKETNTQTIYNGVMSSAGFIATVVGLLFASSTPVGIGTGIASLATAMGTTTRTNVYNLAEVGELELLRIYRVMTNLGATKVSLDLAFLKIYNFTTLAQIVKAVQGLEINYYEKNGIRLTS